nr:hypothetical protein [Acetobacter cibinongensis]
MSALSAKQAQEGMQGVEISRRGQQPLSGSRRRFCHSLCNPRTRSLRHWAWQGAQPLPARPGTPECLEVTPQAHAKTGWWWLVPDAVASKQRNTEREG